MKSNVIKIYIISVIAVISIYICSLYYISGTQNPYNIIIDSDQDYFIIDNLLIGREFEIPIKISNVSNKAISSLLNINLSYHLYKYNSDSQELISIENIRTSLSNILPGDEETVAMKFKVPDNRGKYIIYVDLIEEGKAWYSEYGTLTKPIIIEVD